MAKLAGPEFWSAAVMSIIRYLYDPPQRSVLPVFLVPRARRRRSYDRSSLGRASRALPSPACGKGRGLGRLPSHFTSGSTSYWWNGGGDGKVHSRVVAPGPHGLLAALSLRIKARTIP